VILTTAEQIDAWMTVPWNEAAALQRPLPDGALGIVEHGVKEDGEVQRSVLKQPDIAMPVSLVPRDARTIEVRTIEDGGRYEAAWSPAGITYDDEGREVRAGNWETDDDGGFIADAEADAWLPRGAHAIAAHGRNSR
jgi:hypothetical protein